MTHAPRNGHPFAINEKQSARRFELLNGGPIKLRLSATLIRIIAHNVFYFMGGVCVCILEAYIVCAGVEIRAFWACERYADWGANFDQIIILLMKTSGRRLFVDKQAYD